MLAWWSRSEALSLGIPVDEAEAMLGRVETVWQCQRCSEVGMFGAVVMGDDG